MQGGDLITSLGMTSTGRNRWIVHPICPGDIEGISTGQHDFTALSTCSQQSRVKPSGVHPCGVRPAPASITRFEHVTESLEDVEALRVRLRELEAQLAARDATPAAEVRSRRDRQWWRSIIVVVLIVVAAA